MDIDYEDIHIHSNKKLTSNVFCMYAPNVLEDVEITENFVKNLINMEESVGNLGGFLVIIIDVPKFIERVRNSLKLLGYQSRMHCVGYMDLNKSFDIQDEQIGFIKDISYSNQKEFRILIERDNPDNEPLFLEIGSLEDIGGLTPLNSFNDNFEIRLIEKN